MYKAQPQHLFFKVVVVAKDPSRREGGEKV